VNTSIAARNMSLDAREAEICSGAYLQNLATPMAPEEVAHRLISVAPSSYRAQPQCAVSL
jgi:hypothetical protein